jgi:hypothetical protein
MTKRASTTVRCETRTMIDRPTSDVFARLADLEGYRTWMRRTGYSAGPDNLRRPSRPGNDLRRRHEDGRVPR